MTDDNLVELGAEKLAAMLRDKRKDEASLRARLRETETERDTLRDQHTAWQREQAWGFATEAGVVASARADLERSIDLAALVDDAGLIDGAKVTEAVTGLKETSPHYFRAAPARSGGELSGGTGEGQKTPTATWADVL